MHVEKLDDIRLKGHLLPDERRQVLSSLKKDVEAVWCGE